MGRRTATRSVRLATLALSLGLLPPAMEAQDAPVGTASRDTLLAAAREIMTAARYCALITVGEDGRLQTRTIDAFLPDEAWIVRIGTNRLTRKVREIAGHPDVTLYYFDRASLSYVTLQGRARVVTDPAETRRYWKPEWAAFYPDRDADYLLIAVDPVRLEVVSEVRGITGDARTWRPPTVEFVER